MNELILKLMDALLGWSLLLPRDATLFVVALITAGLMVIARRMLTDQELLRRCAADKLRLKGIIRDARQRGDGDAVARAKAVKQRLAMMAFRSEIKPLAAVIVPIVLLTTWGFQRLNYIPVKEGDVVEVAACFPPAEEGRLAHIVPVDGLETENGWIREVEIEGDSQPYGAARWLIRGTASEYPYDLSIRYRGEVYSIRLAIGDSKYEQPSVAIDSAHITGIEVRLMPYRPFGFLPGLGGSALPAWVVGYLLIALPVASGMKRIFGVR